jgi:hypothetical protein
MKKGLPLPCHLYTGQSLGENSIVQQKKQPGCLVSTWTVPAAHLQEGAKTVRPAANIM